MKHLTDANFDEFISTTAKPVLVKFGANWCGPCRSIEPILEDLNIVHSKIIEIVSCDVDENPLSATKYNIRSIPTMVYFNKGKVYDVQVGAVPKHVIESKINVLNENL